MKVLFLLILFLFGMGAKTLFNSNLLGGNMPMINTIDVVFAGENEQRKPTIDDLLKIKSIRDARISPDGKWVAYTVRETDFEQDAFILQIWLVNTDIGEKFQITRGKKSAKNPEWSPDGKWLTFTSRRIDGKNQIFAIQPFGGEAIQLTNAEKGVSSYKWSPDGKLIAFTSSEPEYQEIKDRKGYMGNYQVIRNEYQHTHIWTFEFTDALEKPTSGMQRTKGKDFSICDWGVNMSWSPDGTGIAFSAAINPDPIQEKSYDIYILNLEDNTVKKIVDMPGPDMDPHWSPDGSKILFSTYFTPELYFAHNVELAVVPAGGGKPRSLTDNFDENAYFVNWNNDGIYFAANQKTSSHLFRLDPFSNNISRITVPDNIIAGSISVFGDHSFSLTRDGKKMAFIASSPKSIREIYVSDVNNFSPKQLTDMTKQIDNFILGTPEVIFWKSKDDTPIEGVLIKPAEFDSTKKHPLLCLLHGGPAAVDRPTLLTLTRYYPIYTWNARGALILLVNYRGSTGYGEDFRRLLVRHIGDDEAEDVLSGVDYLINKGWVDSKKIGCMGWSHGGIMTAFFTTSSDRFVATSVGACISNWLTGYYDTVFPLFTATYMGAVPVDDPEIYQKSSAIFYIDKARTPTLIQHGEHDVYCSTANSYELYRSLKDKGVPVEFVIYKGFAHSITKPKAQRAVMWHNLVWFNHYIWGDPLPDLTKPEIPKQLDKNREKELNTDYTDETDKHI